MPGHIKMYICLSVGQLTGYTPVHWQILQCSIFSMSLGFWGRSGRKQSSCKWGDVKKNMVPLKRIGQIQQNMLICDGSHPSSIALLFFSCSFSSPFHSRMDEEMHMHVFLCVFMRVYLPFSFEWTLRKMLGFVWEGKGCLRNVVLSSCLCKCPVTSSVGLPSNFKSKAHFAFW